MMEFIVLGQIPGTDWRISFTATLLLWLLCVLTARLGWSYHKYHKSLARLETTLLYMMVSQKPAKRPRRA